MVLLLYYSLLYHQVLGLLRRFSEEHSPVQSLKHLVFLLSIVSLIDRSLDCPFCCLNANLHLVVNTFNFDVFFKQFGLRLTAPSYHMQFLKCLCYHLHASCYLTQVLQVYMRWDRASFLLYLSLLHLLLEY